MRRVILIAVCAWCAGFLAASATAFGYAKLNAWRAHGGSFQLGYVVGYLDAVALSKYKDLRAGAVPVGGRPNYELWRDKVNAYFADPANEKRLIPDAMGAVGAEMSRERLKAFHERAAKRSPMPGVSGGASAPTPGLPGAGDSAPRTAGPPSGGAPVVPGGTALGH